MRAIRSLAPLRSVRDVLFPPACTICRTLTGTAEALCGSCWADIGFLDGPVCRHCGRPVVGADDAAGPGAVCEECALDPPGWTRGAAVFRYEGGGRRLVLSLKHGDRQDSVPMLARWMARTGRSLLAEADLVAPVPLHWTRRLKRRGNQAAYLARAACRQAGRAGAFAPELLVRTRQTPSQGGRDRAARTANVANAFAPGRRARMAGRSVLLVDDVLTTGATLSAAARCCRAAGASRVDVLVLAVVVRDQFSYIGAETEDEP